MTSDVQARPATPAPAKFRTLLPGFALTAIGIGLAYAVNLALPPISALTCAVVIGIAVNHLPFLPASTRPGVTWATKKLLRTGVVLLGLQLAVPQLLKLGGGTLLAVVVTVLTAFLGTLGLARLLRVPRGLGLMVATGFSICGASAIAAMEGVTEREDEDERGSDRPMLAGPQRSASGAEGSQHLGADRDRAGSAVATGVALVTLYGGLAIALVPTIGGWLGLHGVALGKWAGLSVHEVAQVVAAATPAGTAAVAAAIVVKLSRVVLLAPMVAGVGLVERRRKAAPVAGGKRPPIVPLFVLGFLVMIGVRSTGLLPAPVLTAGNTLTTLLLAGALFGLGAAVRIPTLIRTGGRAMLLGLCSTVLVGTVAYTTLQLFG